MFISPNILCPSMLLQRIIISDIVPGSFLFFSKYIIFFFVSSLNFLIDSIAGFPLIKLFANSFGLMLKWPIGGDSGLLFNSAKNQISLIDSNAKKKADIEILTLPDKCFINSTMIYCAVMQNYSDVLPKPALPDDYFKKAFYSVDKIYAIGITDNSSEIILSNEELPIVDAVNLSLSGNNLLFINRYDDKVYSLEL